VNDSEILVELDEKKKFKVEYKSDEFDEIVEKITNRNINRSYPDINDMPN